MRDLVNQLVSLYWFGCSSFSLGYFQIHLAVLTTKLRKPGISLFSALSAFCDVSITGLVNLLVNTFGFTDTNKVKPTVPAF